MMADPAPFKQRFALAANYVAQATGRPSSFIICCALVLAWALSGPVFHFSDTWQLVINTGTTIVTFLMVFLIQNTQNRESGALHAKLDELIRAVERAEDRFIGLEQRTEDEIAQMRGECVDNSDAEPTNGSGATGARGALPNTRSL